MGQPDDERVMYSYMAAFVALMCLILFWLTGCTDLRRDWDLPQECRGSLEAVRARVTIPYKLSYVAMPNDRWGMTLMTNPAYVFINKNISALNREVAEQHELCHLIAGRFH